MREASGPENALECIEIFYVNASKQIRCGLATPARLS